MNVDEMRASRKSPQVALTKYHTLRGKRPSTLIFVFEGEDDLPYYETIVRRVNSKIYFSPLIANGKDQVLGLREIISNQKVRDERICFFIDKDYDDSKGHKTGSDLYISEGYSIENHLVSETALRSLLKSEYKCFLPEDDDEVEAIITKFYTLLDRFFEQMFEANLAIYHARKNNVRLRNIEDRISKYLDFDFNEVKKSDTCHLELIGWPDDKEKVFNSSKTEFQKLNPEMDWRGKFIYDFFTKILKILKDDRTSSNPKIFSRKQGIRYDPNGEMIRSLTTLSETPKTLEAFIAQLNE